MQADDEESMQADEGVSMQADEEESMLAHRPFPAVLLPLEMSTT